MATVQNIPKLDFGSCEIGNYPLGKASLSQQVRSMSPQPLINKAIVNREYKSPKFCFRLILKVIRVIVYDATDSVAVGVHRVRGNKAPP